MYYYYFILYPVKGYIRKGQALFAMKDLSKAMSAYQKALELDPNNYDAAEGLKACYKSDDPEARRKTAMQNPEVQQIMTDPAMQLILQQMQENPAAIREWVREITVYMVSTACFLITKDTELKSVFAKLKPCERLSLNM